MFNGLGPRRHRPTILAFHEVRSASWLRDFLRALSRRADVLPLATVVDDHLRGVPVPSRVAITFDDGYKSIRTIVEPVFTELRMPFTTFVCTDVLTGGPAPWYDRLGLLVANVGVQRAASRFGPGGGRIWSVSQLRALLKETPRDEVLSRLDRAEATESIDPRPLRERYMDVVDLKAVASNPLATVGSHTWSHPILANLDAGQQRAEIERGLQPLRELCRTAIEYFAYPNGKPRDFDTAVVACLREQGIRAAVTSVQRPVNHGDDVMQLPRLGVSDGDSIHKLELKWALPWFSVGDATEEFWRYRYQTRRGIN